MNNDSNVILLNLSTDRFNSIYRQNMEQLAEGREIICTTDRNEIEKNLPRIEICIGSVPTELFVKMPRLRWIQTWAAGVDWLMAYPELKEHPVKITNSSGIHREQITEHIFGLILSHRRCFPFAFANQKKHEWQKADSNDLSVIAGKTMLILGYGAIGEQCAKAALGFGMKVIGVKRHARAVKDEIRIETIDKLHELLGEADYVVNILPYTHNTHGLFGKKEFGLMKNSAIYVNVGRGLTTDEDALIDALKTGKISAALLDVTAEEPLSKDSPLWDMENVIITAHYAGLRPEYSDLAMDIALENLKRYNKGEELVNLVDKNAGY